MLREEQIHRYARHIVLGAVGVHGQQALLEASATVGIGEHRGSSHCAMVYLVAAGVSIRLTGDVDGPVTATEVDCSLIFESVDIGRPRLEVVRERVEALNPDVTVQRGAPGEAAGLEVVEHTVLADAIAAGAAAATRTVNRILTRSDS